MGMKSCKRMYIKKEGEDSDQCSYESEEEKQPEKLPEKLPEKPKFNFRAMLEANLGKQEDFKGSVQSDNKSEGEKIFASVKQPEGFSKSLVNQEVIHLSIGEGASPGIRQPFGSIGKASDSSNDSQNKMASVSTAPTATVASGTVQKDAIVRKLSKDLE